MYTILEYFSSVWDPHLIKDTVLKCTEKSCKMYIVELYKSSIATLLQCSIYVCDKDFICLTYLQSHRTTIPP